MLDVNEVYSLLERSSLRGDQAAMTTLQAMGGGNQALESKGFASALATIISQGQQQQEQQTDMGNDAGRQEVRLMASILLKATPKSLVLIDEFGKGTSPASGIAILGAALKRLAEIKCKTVCTTHFLELFSMSVIQDGVDGIKARRMAIHLPSDNEDGASPLFKLEDGVASSSAGLICAKKTGLSSKVIDRAKDIIQSMRERRQIDPLEEATPEVIISSAETDILHHYLSVDAWQNASEEDLRILIQNIARI